MNRIIVALDLPTMVAARRMAERLSGVVGGFKIGLELLTGVGPSAIEDIATLGKPVFADAKLHDIPTTVERAAANLAASGARWVTVHVSGGKEMIRAAVSGMNGDGVLGVTMLTSLAEDDLVLTGEEPNPGNSSATARYFWERASWSLEIPHVMPSRTTTVLPWPASRYLMRKPSASLWSSLKVNVTG